MTDPVRTVVVFVLVIACAALWYGGRAVRRGAHAPAWARGLQGSRALAMLLLGGAVLALVGLGVAALLALALEKT